MEDVLKDEELNSAGVFSGRMTTILHDGRDALEGQGHILLEYSSCCYVYNYDY